MILFKNIALKFNLSKFPVPKYKKRVPFQYDTLFLKCRNFVI